MSHPQGETGLTRRDDGIALILIAEPPKKVIKLVIHLENPGLSHPQGETGLTCRDDGIALILIAESRKKVIKLAIHLGNPGSDRFAAWKTLVLLP